MQTQTATRANKILVVDDDARIRDLLRRYLAQEGFEVMVAEDARALNRLLLRESVDLIVLDLMMPGEDGLSVCRRLRGNNDRTPIIMLTAKSEDVDRIVGLEVGADDYLGKPFNPRELLARVRALLRRSGSNGASSGGGSAAATAPRPGLLIDPARRLATLDGQDLELTGSEFALLRRLAAQAGEPVSRDTLYRDALQRRWNPLDRALDQHIVGLRRKLGAQAVATVRGRGYQLTLPLAAPPHPRAER